MILLSNKTQQTLIPGQAITFDTVVLKYGCCECHRENATSVKLRQRALYEIEFAGNIGAVAAGTANLAIQLGGQTLPETTMKSVTATAGDLNNVATQTLIKNCCCDYDRITVVNVGTENITIDANTSLLVKELRV